MRHRWKHRNQIGICFILAAAMVLSPASALAAVYQAGSPTGLCATEDGLLVVDSRENQIYKLEDGKYREWIGRKGIEDIYGIPTGGYQDTDYANAYFERPYDITPYLNGYAISDTANNVIRYAAEGVVYTLAGAKEAGYVNAKGIDARFQNPKGLATDAAGNLYAADTLNDVIRKIDTNGNVTTYAGSTGGFQDGSRLQAAFCEPQGLCWYQDSLYVADTGNQRIRKITGNQVITLAGSAAPMYEDTARYAGDYKDGTTKEALFDEPSGIVVRNGCIYVADTGNSAIRKIENYRVTTIDQLPDQEERLYPAQPFDLTFAGQSFYVSDAFTGTIYTLPEPAWKTTVDKKILTLLKQLPKTVKADTKILSIGTDLQPRELQTRGTKTIPVRLTTGGTLDCYLYSKTAGHTATLYQKAGKKGKAGQITLTKAHYDGGSGSYVNHMVISGLKAGTYYLLADRGGYVLNARMIPSQNRNMTSNKSILAYGESEKQSLYYKYTAYQTGTLTVSLQFLNLTNSGKASGTMVLCSSKKKASGDRLALSSAFVNSKNQAVYSVKKGKTYYVKVNAQGAYQIKAAFKGR